MFFIEDMELKELLKAIKKANRKRKPDDPLIEYTLLASDSTGPRIKMISGYAPLSFWSPRPPSTFTEKRLKENVTPRRG